MKRYSESIGLHVCVVIDVMVNFMCQLKGATGGPDI